MPVFYQKILFCNTYHSKIRYNQSMKFIAYCTKGLEDIAVKEITKELRDSKIIKMSTKRIIFESNSDYLSLSNLRTIDDLAIYIDRIELSKLTKLDQVTNRLSELNIPELIKNLKEYRGVNEDKFSLTISVIHYKRFSRDEIKDALAKKISEKYELEYQPLDHTNFDIRINIENSVAWIGIRLTPESLFNRNYRINPMLGSLKPTIAAAMINLATENKINLKIVDNFCGSGTILCESLLAGNEVYGGDISPIAVKATIENLKSLSFKNDENIRIQDAIKTNWSDKFFDCAISNLPWGKQIEIESITNLYEGCIKEYARIVKEDGTICLILSKPDLMKSLALKYLPNAKIQEIQIGFLGQKPSILIIRR